MTMTTTQARTAESAAGVVTEFFDRYRAHDIDGMTDLCSINADFSYVPFEIWGKQRVLRGDGKVGTVGKTIWAGLIKSFPDLSNTVHTITANDDGDVVVGGGGVHRVRQVGEGLDQPRPDRLADGADLAVAAYWDNAGISRQLRHTEVD